MDDDALSEVVSDGAEVVSIDGGKKKGPFGGLDHMEAARRSVEKRRQNAVERERDAALRREGADMKIKNAPSREVLKGAAAAVLFEVAEKILVGEIPINTAREAASVADTFFNILRLESGQSTSNVEHLTHDEKLARIKEMQEEARKRAAATGYALPPAPES